MQSHKKNQTKLLVQDMNECKAHLKSTTIQIIVGNVAAILTLAGAAAMYAVEAYIACTILTIIVGGYGWTIHTAYKTKRILKSIIAEQLIRLERLNKR